MAGDPKPNAGGVLPPKPRWSQQEILLAIMDTMLDPDIDPALLPELRELAGNPSLLARELAEADDLAAFMARQRATKAGKAKPK
jgi:hypothetical protein